MGLLPFESGTSPVTLISVFTVFSVVYVVGKIIHKAFFGPLSHIPGPRITAVSRIPYACHLVGGTVDKNLKYLHEKYGEVVRFSPNEVSYISGETAWSEIYGFRTGNMKGHLNMQKDPVWFPPPSNGVPSILIANDEDHSRGRRLLSHAFSEKALMAQEQLIQNYVNQLIDRVAEVTAATKKAVDLSVWFNWTTFDLINDLIFGEPLGCLQNQTSHENIQLLSNNIQAFRFAYVMTYFPWLKRFGNLLIDKDFKVKRAKYMQWVESQTTKRIERETQRPDLMSYILMHNGEKGLTLSKAEIDSNANLMLIAGSETSATVLAGTTYLLLTNPTKLQKLQDEVRGRWNEFHDITIEEVIQAPYLNAVLSEGMRCFPPVPAGFQRVVNVGGETVSGYYLPQGTAVSMSQQAAYHSPNNFKDPEVFVPERWMGDPAYANDRKAVLQPFSTGPRNCLGKNLAYAELRLILAKMIWKFDMELEERSREWMSECTLRTLWVKPELAVKLHPVVRD